MSGKIFLHGGHLTLFNELKSFFKGSNNIVLLTDGLKDNIYEKEWKEYFNNIKILSPKNKDDIDYKLISKADGIIIGGGQMSVYNEYYNNELFKDILTTSFNNGINIAGISAGAMILGEYFWLEGITVIENGEKIKLSTKMGDEYEGDFKFTKGLGILEDKVVGVHIREKDENLPTLEVMKQSGMNTGIGLDEDTVVIVQNNKVIDKFGKGNSYKFNI